MGTENTAERRIAELEAERDELRARLADIEAQQPVAWIEHEWSGGGRRQLHFDRRPACLRDEVVAPIWTPLYARPVTAQPMPDGSRQAVLLTDAEVRQIETAVLAANGLEVRRG